MQLLCILLLVIALILAKYSWKCLIYYSTCAGASLWLVHVFLVNKFELDFDVVFKFFEWIGYGTPRFLEGRTTSTSENASQDNYIDCKIPKPVSDSVDNLVNNVLRDFVKSWYKEVADGDVFVAESKTVLNRLATEIYIRMSQLDSHYLVEQVILVFHAHLVRFNRSVDVLKNNDPNLKLTVRSSQVLSNAYDFQVYPKHVALSNSVSELNYLRTVVDTLLTALAPRDVFSCDMGRFILREILAVQTVELVDLLSDSDWINEAIIDLLSPPVPKQRKITAEQLDNFNSLKELTDNSSHKSNVSFCPTQKVQGFATRSANLIKSETKQVELAEGRTDPDELDNKTIESSSNDSNLPQRKENLTQLESANGSNVNNSLFNSFVEIPLSDLQVKDQESQSSFENSWGFCPSAQDNTFHTESFEAMKAKALERERKLNSSQKVKGFGTEVKKLGSCCTKFDVSVDVDQNSSRLRCRSVSLPDELQIIPDRHEQHMPVYHKRSVTRSVSFPASISSVIELDEESSRSTVSRPVRSTTVRHPSHSYGSPYQNLSFCSSEGSFKSFSDEDSDLEEAQEMDEQSDSDDNETLENIAPLPIMRPPRRKSISRQAEVIEDGCFGANEKLTSLPEYNMSHGQSRITENGFHTNKNSPQSSKDSDSSDRRSPTESSCSPKLESDTSFGDTVIMAGRKFISSIRSPVKKFGFSSSSSKSTSMSSGADSMEVNVPSSVDTASFDSDLPLYRPPQADSPSTSRKLSRSNAVMDISSESDTETFYGTPASIRQEIVYGTSALSAASGNNGGDVVRIHPSQMISIPSSETAFESDWEPGRNKFTLYRIEYDIRIWPNVYKTLLEECSKQGDDNETKEHKKKLFHHKRAIKRRYREFMELHSRLTNGPLGIFMKDILKPNRKYNLPFGRLDKDVVEGRRSLLQYYLVSLVSKPELRDSHELQQFLGVIGGGSFIKPSVAKMMSQSVHVPRVDKMLSRQMTKVIDSIKTAFDSDDQETLDGGRVSPLPDIGCPWSIECHGNNDAHLSTLDENQVDNGDCFSAFLENLEFSKPCQYFDNSDSESSFHESSSDDDAVSTIIDPLVANDRSDIPNQSSQPSAVSKDDMLYGVLGSKPPGICIPHSFSYCAGDGNSFETDMVDFGRNHGRRVNKVSPESNRKTTSEPRSSEESLDNSSRHSTRHPKISKRHVDKLKSAAQKAKEKKTESFESLSQAKDRVKQHISSSESLENITHAKEKVKAFKKNVESMENISHAKEKMRSLKKKIPDVESMENLHQAREKVKAFKNKIPDAEENLAQAKEKVKKLKKKIPNVESMENLNQAKEKVKAFKQKLPDAEENLHQAKEKVKEFKKKIPTPESNENLAQAKEKVQSLKKKMSKSPKFSKKEQFTANDENVDQLVKPLKPERPSPMSVYDEPSEPVADVAEDIFPEDPQFPLSHAILNLTCEVMKGHGSWASLDRVQESFKGMLGALFEWFVRSEIDDVLTDECWSEYLDNLNDVVWPDGKLLEKTDQVKTDEQKEQTKQKAIQTLKEFFPEIFQLLVGTKVYHECASNAVESLQNPAINRILIYILLELFLSELIPELQRNMYTDIHDL